MKMLVVDAFTDHPFAGNPAGVCLLERAADPAWMQRVAAEMRHSETAFVRPIEGPDADYELRWFTPMIEVALCGHATLATAHALYDTGTVPAGSPIRFQTLRSGVLTVTREPGGGLVMDFPANPPAEVQPPDELGAALRTTPFWTGRTAQNDLFVLVADEEAVRKLEPDNKVLGGLDARGVIVTAKADPGQEHDFVSRFFGGGLLLGDGEDPVTGSAHCALGPYWGQELGKDVLTGYQASERGGTVGLTLRGDRVILTGSAVTVLEGEFKA